MSWSGRFVSAWSALVLAGAVLITSGAAAAKPEPQYKPDEVIIKFRDGVPAQRRQAILSSLGSRHTRHFNRIRADHVGISHGNVKVAIARFKHHPDVEYIEPNYIIQPDVVPNDPLFSNLWGMLNTGQTGGVAGADIRATQAWNVSTGSTAVLVGIIDTGVDYTHSDLLANIFVNPGEVPGNAIDDDHNGFIDDVHGWDFADNDNDPTDIDGHGTHVAGTCGAVGNNGIGVAGVNWHVKLLPIRMLGPLGGTTEDAIRSIEYAAAMGVDVINASWGGGGFSEALRSAILDAEAAGTIFVAAAGNSNANNDLSPHYPSTYDVPSLVAVAATDHRDVLASYSNYGLTTVDLAAPGSGILSTFPGNAYGTISGTSMATPHVSGVLALIFARNPGISPIAAKNLLLSTVDPRPSLTGRILTGGRLNALLAIAERDSVPPGLVSNLSATLIEGSRVELGWTATGDDGGVGRASRYEVRYATTPITQATFSSATLAVGPPNPDPAGSPQAMNVPGLAFSTRYYFALRAFDEFDNGGPISNVASATTLGSPEIAVEPMALSADLLTGQTAMRTLTLHNTGASELLFEVSVSNASLSEISVDVITPKRKAPGAVLATGRPVSLESFGQRRSEDMPADLVSIDRTGGGAIVPAGPGRQVVNSNQEIFGSNQNPFFAGPRMRGNMFACTTTRQLREHRIYLDPGVSTELWFLVYEGMAPTGNFHLISASNATPSGSGLGWYSSGPVDVELVAGRHYLIAASFAEASTYFNQQNIFPYPIPASFGSLTGAVGWTWAPDAQFPPVSNVNVSTNVYSEPVAYYQTLITDQMISWLSVAPPGGRVGRAETLQLAVTFNAAGLYGGDYDATVRISNNDPDESEVLVPAHLHVTGAPDIDVSPTAIDFGSIFIGGERIDTVRVENQGTDLLHVSSVTITPSAYTVPAGGFDLAPGETRNLAVKFRPTSVGAVNGSLTVQSNDVDEGTIVVPLAGGGLLPPDIEVTPGSLSANLLTGQRLTRSLTIRNTGLSDLSYTLSTRVPELAPILGAPMMAAAAGPMVPWDGVQVGSMAIPGQDLLRPLKSGLDPPGGRDRPDGAPDVLVLTTTPIASSLLRILGELGRNYEVRIGEDFTNINFTPYTTIIAAMDGGYINESSCEALANAASTGRLVFMIGGTNLIPFYNGMQTYLLGHDGVMGWTTSQSPHLNVTNPGDPLAQGLPPTVTFNTIEASYYMLRISDPAATVVARNGNGNPVLVHKIIGAGTLVYYVNPPDEFAWRHTADYAIFKQIVTNTLELGAVPWVRINPEAGTVAPGQSAIVEVEFDAAGLFGGDYEGEIVVESNDPDEAEIAVPAHLHVTGAPDISVSRTSIDFGTFFLGLSRAESLEVRNAGTDVLNVSGISLSSTEYQLDVSGGFTVAPSASRSLVVTYRPTIAAPAPATLTLHSNDVDEADVTVTLSGVGLVPPEISVAPDSLSADLLTGQTATRMLRVTNSGGNPLTFNVGLMNPQPSLHFPQISLDKGQLDARHGPPVLDGRGGPDQFGYRWIDSDEPGGPAFDWVEIAGVGTLVPVSGDDWNFGPIPIGFNFPYYGQEFSSVRVCSNGWISFTSPSAQFGNYPLPTPFAPENMLAALWADLGTGPGSVIYHNDGMRLIVEYQNVSYLSGGPPFTFQIQIYPNGRIVYQYLDLGGAPTYGAVGIQNAARDDGLTVAYNTAYLHNGLAIQFSAVPPWLSVSPSSGTVLVGSYVDLEVGFDASGMYGGTYDERLVISNNDPDESEVAVPLHLRVTGAPDIDLSRTSIDFGPLFVGLARSESLVVRNAGTDLLTVSSITVSSTEYQLDVAGGFLLAPSDARSVIVTYRPTVAAPAPAMVTVHSNDVDEGILTVALSGSGMIPPDIDVDPDSLSANLLTGQQATRLLRIHNTGLASLAFTVVTRPPTQAGIPAIGFTMPPPPAPWNHEQVGTVAIPGREQSQPMKSGIDPPGGRDRLTGTADILVMTTTQISNSVLRALDELGRSYHIRYTEDFTGIDFAPYGIILVAMNGGYVSEASCAALAGAAGEGRLVFIIGGSNWGPYYNGLQSYLLGHNNEMGWITSPPPHLTVTNPADPLAFGLPATVNYGTFESSYYMLRITDPAATVAAVNGNGAAALVHKALGAGTLVYYVNPPDDFAWVNAADYTIFKQIVENGMSMGAVPWLSVSPENGSIPPGQTATIQVQFNATGLYGGDYEARVVVNSNDPDEAEVGVPAHLHVTGAPDIDLSRTSIDFGTLFVGASHAESLDVRNTGTDLLTVSAITVSSPRYEVNVAGGFTVAPATARTVLVTFHPTAAGPATATLTVHSNDADEAQVTAALSGFGVVAPDIAVDPDSLSVDLVPDQQTTRTVRISNTGGSPLTFNLAPLHPQPSLLFPQTSLDKGQVDARHGPPVVDGRGGPDQFGYRWIDSDEPGGPVFDWVEISGVGTPVPSSGDDWNFGPVDIGFDFPFYGEQFSSLRICSNGWISFTSPSAQYINYPLPHPYAPENMLAVLWADLFTTPGSVSYYNDGTRLIVEYQNVTYLGGGQAFTFQIHLYPNGRINYQYLEVGGFPTYGAVGIQNATLDDGLTVAFNTTYLHNGLAVQFAAVPQWLSVSPMSGTVPVGSHLDLEVGFNATRLEIGPYDSELFISSNDPDEDPVRVAAHLNVVDVPDIDSDAVDFGPRYVGQPVTLPVVLRNAGRVPLHLSSISISGAGFSFNPEPVVPATIPGLDTLPVRVRFAPAAPCSPCTGSLTVISDDPDEHTYHVPLSGTALVRPEVLVTPLSLSAAVAPQLGDVADDQTQTLIVRNTGGSDLEVSLRRRPTPAVVAAAGPEVPRTQGSGGPDAFGYSWTDSDSPGGPSFSWVEIATPDHRLPLSGNDNMYLDVPIGFSFPFYGESYQSVHVCTNGFLSFTGTYPSPNNVSLPRDSTNVPRNLIAPFWDDLLFGSTQRAYAQHDADRFVLSWVNVNTASPGGGAYTFQVILEPSGKITYQYQSMAGTLSGATVGIQNPAGDDGLTAAFNQSFIHNGLAVQFNHGPEWLTIDPIEFVVPAGGATNVAVRFDGHGLDDGDYAGELSVHSNDLETPIVIVPVALHVGAIDIAFDLDPNSLNRNSNGRWVKGDITVPVGYDPHAIDISSVLVQGVVPVDSSGPVTYSGRTMKCKFDRESVLNAIVDGDNVPVVVVGKIGNQSWFTGLTIVRMVRPHVGTPNAAYHAGSQVDLTWTDGGPAVLRYDLWYSANDGESWVLAGGNLTQRHYLWTVPLVTTNVGRLELVATDALGVMGSWMSSTLRIVPPNTTAENDAPLRFALRNIGANPADGRAALELSLPQRTEVTVEVYDVRGARIRDLERRVFEPGWHRLEWDGLRDNGGAAGNGVYFIRARAAGKILNTRVAMLR